MTKFRKKPVVIEAFRWEGPAKSWEAMGKWLTEANVPHGMGLFNAENGTLEIDTLEGTMTAQAGDWIIRGVKGELYPCKPDIFEATYDAVDQDVNRLEIFGKLSLHVFGGKVLTAEDIGTVAQHCKAYLDSVDPHVAMTLVAQEQPNITMAEETRRIPAKHLAGLLEAHIAATRMSKPNDRSEVDRAWAVTLTELEKVLAYFQFWVVQREVVAE